MSLADYQQLVADMVRDVGGVLNAAERDRAISQAVQDYGAALPRVLVHDMTWPVAGVFGPVPPHWEDGSAIRCAEYPVGQQPPKLIHVAAFRAPDGWMLETTWHLPLNAIVRLTYTASHAVNAAQDTVPLHHRSPVAMLAASKLCLQLATYYSGQRETVVGADASSTEIRAREYAARAKEYRSAYYVGVGLPDPYRSANGAGSAQAAAAVAQWPRRRRHQLTPRSL